MIFKHTHRERGMWRGWLKNGQSLELNRSRSGWDFGAGVLIHSNGSAAADRMLCLKFWRFSAYIPLGIIRGPFTVGDEPQWSAFGSADYGVVLHWGQRRRSFDWPWAVFTVAYESQLPDGTWRSVFDSLPRPHFEEHPYTYTLASGEVQNRTATVSKRRHVLRRRWGWWKWIKESIHVEFSDEVGERTGSWKGGTIGCGYDLRPGETLLECLRRMERERSF